MTSVETRLRSDLLYLVVDMPSEPRYHAYARQVGYLHNLVLYCAARTGAHRADIGVLDIRVVRTSMASPWVTVLGEAARTSAPIAYGMSGLYIVHKLLKMVMDWQNHRQGLKERRDNLQEAIILLRDFERETGSEQNGSARIARSIAFLNDVTTAEIVEDDDPRVRGQD